LSLPQGMAAPGIPILPGAPGASGNQTTMGKNVNQLAEMKLQAAKPKDEPLKKVEPDAPKCHLHKKPNKKCRFCEKYKEAVEKADRLNDERAKEKAAADAKQASSGPRHKPGLDMLNAVLKDQILRNVFFKKLVQGCEDQQTLVDELYQNVEHAEPSQPGGEPSQFMCCVAWMLGVKPPTDDDVQEMICHKDSAYIRCAGFLFLRLSRSDDLWSMCGPYVLDDQEFNPTRDKKERCSIGVYVQELLLSERYFGTTMPRLPMQIKRNFEMNLIGVDEWRKRIISNKERLVKFDVGAKVEALTNNDWLSGVVTAVDDSVLSCIKLDIKFEDGAQEVVSLGKVVLPWPKGSKRDRSDSRGRSRSRSRDRDRSRSRSRSRSRGERDRSSDRSRTPDRRDWSYYKGARQSELIEKWRSQEKEKALSSGRDRRNTDGYVPNVFRPVPRTGDGKNRHGKTEQEIAEEAAIAEQLEERARREKEEKMAAIFSKYSGGGGGGSTSAKPSDDADVVRLG